MKAIDKMIVMGAAMDASALKAGGDAHHKGVGSMDGKLVTSLADYTAMNAAIGHMVSSAGEAKTMDVYKSIAGFNLGTDVGPCMMSSEGGVLGLLGVQGCCEGVDLSRQVWFFEDQSWRHTETAALQMAAAQHWVHVDA